MKFLTVVVYDWIKHKCRCTFDPEMYAWSKLEIIKLWIIVGKPDNPEFTHSMLAACMNLAGRARCIEIAAGAEKRRFRCAKRNPGSTGGSSA